MNPILKNIISLFIGAIVGGFINMQTVELGYSVFPLGDFDKNNFDAFVSAMENAENKHYIFPFLAHAFGTFVGATLASLFGANHQFRLAIIIGIFFLIGGIAANLMIPGPLWFSIMDILLAYIPMAWIGHILASKYVSSRKSNV